MTDKKPKTKKSIWLSGLSDEAIKATIIHEVAKAIAAKESRADFDNPPGFSAIRAGRKAGKLKVKVQPGLLKVLRICHNNESELARALGVSPQAVQQWFLKGYAPMQRCTEMFELFGVPAIETCNPVLTQDNSKGPPTRFTDMIAKTINTNKKGTR
jgi:hypothetical protein